MICRMKKFNTTKWQVKLRLKVLVRNVVGLVNNGSALEYNTGFNEKHHFRENFVLINLRPRFGLVFEVILFT